MRNNSRSPIFKQRAGSGLVSQTMRQLVERRANETQTYLEVICEAQIQKAMDGDNDSAKIIFERIDGKPSQTMDVPQALSVLYAADPEAIAEALGIPVAELEQRRKEYQQAQLVTSTAGEENMTNKLE